MTFAGSLVGAQAVSPRCAVWNSPDFVELHRISHET
jgi:hypothetical protein